MKNSKVWVSWEGGVISAGKGSLVSDQTVFSYNLMFQPHYIYATGKNAKWYFLRGTLRQNYVYSLNLSRGGSKVIVPTFHAGGWGSILRRTETLESVSVNHSLTGPRCKNDTSKCWEDRIMCTSPVWNVLR